MRRFALIALVILFVLQAFAIVRGADRQPHVDEVEYLHAAWLMAQGERVYESFFEHHPPFLFAVFEPLASSDVPAFFVRARLLSGAFGLTAMAAFAAIVWRVRPEAAAIAVALVFASPSIWGNGLTAARAEPFAMAFFWCGAALVLLASPPSPRLSGERAGVGGSSPPPPQQPLTLARSPRAGRGDIVRGAGLGLVAIAALWTPKWPFCSVVVAAFWLLGTRRRVLGAIVAAAVSACGVATLAVIAPLDRIWFFSVEYNRVLWPWLSRSQELLARELRGGEAFLFAPSLLHPLLAVVPILAVAVMLRRNRLVVFLLLMAAAAMLELRFTFPWPVIWSYYYLMWGLAAAALIGLLPAAVERVKFAAPALTGILLLAAAAHIAVSLDIPKPPPSVSLRYFQSRIAPSDTVLLELTRHPVAARDASYYWFGYGYILPVAEELRNTPRGRRYLPPTDQPLFCADLKSLRFVSHPRLLRASPQEQQCFEQLNFAKTPFADVFEAPGTRSR